MIAPTQQPWYSRAATAIGGRLRTALGYDAAETGQHRRRQATTTLVSEDQELTRGKRARVINSGRDLVRNFTVAAWMIRKHLDFVSSFHFQAATPDETFNAALEAYIERRGKKEYADRRAIHPLRRLVRMSEARACLDGDIFWLKLRDGAVQAIEGDRVRDPERRQRDRDHRWTHGIRTDRAGRPLEIGLHNRDGRGFKFDRAVPWSSVIMHGSYDTHHRFDATRCVGPIVTALDELRDLYDVKTFAIAKAKIAQLFGMIIYSDSADGVGSHTPNSEGSDPDGDGDIDQPRYNVDFGKGPLKLELDAGDKAEFLEGKQASGETVAFLKWCIQVALKSLDLPTSFWDEAHTNFFGSKSALTLYLQSANRKRDNVRELLDAWTAWQITYGVGERELELPAGVTLDELLGGGRNWLWIPSGLPWFDRVREIKPAIEAIRSGLDRHSRLIPELWGMSFDDWLAKCKRDQVQARNSGVKLPAFAEWFEEEVAA